MKKVAYLLLAFCAMIFVSCDKSDDGLPEFVSPNKGKQEPPKEMVRVLDDFENGGMLTWTPSKCKFELVANPAKDDVNKSETVGKYTTSEAQWDYIWCNPFGTSETVKNPEFLDFTIDGYIFKLDCYAPAAGIKMYLKAEGGDGVPSKEIKNVVTTKANQWETLEYNYKSMEVVDGVYKKFVICADAGGTTDNLVIYIDNLRQSK